MKLIVDAMGGDNAPRAIVQGTVQAMNECPDITVTMVGDREAIGEELANLNFDENRLEIIHTTQLISMDDSPVKAIKGKTDSSMVVALNLLAKDNDSMLISAGSTGALVAGATLIVKRMPGIKRPALAPVLPSQTGEVMLIDCGANVDCKPQYLSQFGVMGSVYMHKVFGVDKPRVALINNGAEAEKGNELTKAAYKLLKEAPVNFVGNAEGRDLLSGEYDVLVCDGFTGNIVLKFLEGCAKTILGMLKGYIMESTASKIGAALMKGSFSKLKTKMDYSEYGGALLLGLNGGVMKAHGSSDERAIYSAVKAARKFLKGNVVSVIKEEIAVLAQSEKNNEEARKSAAVPAPKRTAARKPAPAKGDATAKGTGEKTVQAKGVKKVVRRTAQGTPGVAQNPAGIAKTQPKPQAAKPAQPQRKQAPVKRKPEPDQKM